MRSLSAILSWLAKCLFIVVMSVYTWIAVALMVAGLLTATPVAMAIGFALLAAPVIADKVRRML